MVGAIFPYMVMEENEGILFSTIISLYGKWWEMKAYCLVP